MDDQRAVARNVARQREWYGEPLGDRVRRLVVAFNVSQAQLAEVLGLSAPMLSQLMSGRRAKIGNPAVLARMVMLERRVLTPAVASVIHRDPGCAGGGARLPAHRQPAHRQRLDGQRVHRQLVDRR